MHHRHASKHTFSRSIFAQFFFFHRGTLLQKSFEGFIRSVLHQILQQSDALTDLLLRYEAQLPTQENHRWTTTRLETALYHILRQRQENSEPILYLDALDEFDGDPERIALFLLTCAREAQDSRTRLKICFASRPWNVFNDKFTNTPQFCVEDHTADDMQFYIRARLSNHRASSQMLLSTTDQVRDAIEDLQKEVFRQANGVFLWVRLVLDTLLKELTEGASVAELRKILETLPPELEQLYIALTKRIPAQYRREGYIMLEIVLRAVDPLSPQEPWDAEQCAFHGLDHVGHYRCALQEDMFVDTETKSRRIRSRCGGLIEILKPIRFQGRTGPSVVQLMHQTAKEFLLNPDTRHFFTRSEDHVARMNGHSFLAQYHLTILAQFTAPAPEVYPYPWPSHKSWLMHVNQCMYHAKKAKMSLGRSQLRLVQSVGDNRYADFARASHRSLRLRDVTRWSSLVNSALSFAAIADLGICVRDAIAKSSPTPADLGYLLHCVIERQSSLDTLSEGHEGVEQQPDLMEMFRLVLDAGADTTVQVNGRTPFEAVFRHGWTGSGSKRIRFKGAMVEVLLGSPGADLNVGILDSDRVMSPTLRRDRHVPFKPLHLAVLGGAVQLVESLLRRGADVNAVSGHGRTPLEELYCISFDLNSHFYKCAKLLLDYGGKAPKQSPDFTPEAFDRFKYHFPDKVPHTKTGFMSRRFRRLLKLKYQ